MKILGYKVYDLDKHEYIEDKYIDTIEINKDGSLIPIMNISGYNNLRVDLILDPPLVDIEAEFKERFPKGDISIKTEVHRVATVPEGIFFTPAFDSYLDSIASKMSDEEYMNTDFLIGD